MGRPDLNALAVLTVDPTGRANGLRQPMGRREGAARRGTGAVVRFPAANMLRVLNELIAAYLDVSLMVGWLIGELVTVGLAMGPWALDVAVDVRTGRARRRVVRPASADDLAAPGLRAREPPLPDSAPHARAAAAGHRTPCACRRCRTSHPMRMPPLPDIAPHAHAAAVLAEHLLVADGDAGLSIVDLILSAVLAGARHAGGEHIPKGRRSDGLCAR